MITPLMLLLSGIRSDFTYDRPVDISYLMRSDRTLLLREATRLGEKSLDESYISVVPDANGGEVCDTVQYTGTGSLDIHIATALILTRIRESYLSYKRYSEKSSSDLEEDLDADIVVMRLEGKPDYVYTYVYQVMDNKALDYMTRINMIYQVYSIIDRNTGVSLMDLTNNFLSSRLEQQSHVSFWQQLIMNDWMSRFNAVPDVVDENTLKTVQSELDSLGFYGFVNPWKMYTDFISSRVNRKLELNIEKETLDFLRTVVKSGGVPV